MAKTGSSTVSVAQTLAELEAKGLIEPFTRPSGEVAWRATSASSALEATVAAPPLAPSTPAPPLRTRRSPSP